MSTVTSSRSITVDVNGTTYEREVEARQLLIHFIRDDLDLTGSHIGCDTGNCGACSVIVDGSLVKSCMMLAVQADGADVETVEGLADGEELSKLQQAFKDSHALQCGYCTPGMLMSATALLALEPAPVGRRDQERPAGQHLSLHGLLEHRRGGQGGVRMTGVGSTEPGRSEGAGFAGAVAEITVSTTVAPETTEVQAPAEEWKGQSVPRKEDRRLVQGQGVFVDDVKRHGMGFIHFVRSPYAHAHIASIDVSKAEELPGVYGTLTGEEVAALTDPFFQISSVPGANLKDFALAVGKVRYVGEAIVAVVAETRERARDASELVEIEYEPLAAVSDARHAQADSAPTIHEDAGGNLMWHGTYEWGDLDAAFAEADRIVKIDELHFHRFNSTPLECDGALVEYNKGIGQWTIHTNNQFPGFAAIMMGPAMRTGLDKLRFVTQDIGGGFGNKITSHPQLVACCLLARKLGRPVQWTEWRTDFHMSMSHGNERWFHETEVAVKNDGTLLGFRTKALDDAGAFPRYEPLGGVIWAQVTPGMYNWRNIRLDFTQVVTNKAPVLAEPRLLAHAAPLVHGARDRHRRARARPRPGRDPQAELHQDRGHAVRDAERLRLRLGRLRADARHRPRAGRLPEHRATPSEAQARGKLLGVGIGSTLDCGTNNFGQSRMINPELQFSGNNEVAMVKLDIFGEIVVTLGTTPQGQGHETTAAQVVADILTLGRRCPRADRPRLVLELARGLLRDVRDAVRGHRPERREGRDRPARRRHQEACRRGVRRRARGGVELAEGGVASRTIRCVLPFMAVGAISDANNAVLPEDLGATLELPLRLYRAPVRGARTSSASSAT